MILIAYFAKFFKNFPAASYKIPPRIMLGPGGGGAVIHMYSIRTKNIFNSAMWLTKTDGIFFKSAIFLFCCTDKNSILHESFGGGRGDRKNLYS